MKQTKIKVAARAKKALATRMDGDPAIRAALKARLSAAADKVPIALLHHVITVLESSRW